MLSLYLVITYHTILYSFLTLIPRPPTPPLFPYTTLFRSEDEAETALLGRNILHYGKPVASDGMNVISQEAGHEFGADQDRKSTRLNSSHLGISYAVFCLKKKKKRNDIETMLKD